jgi:3-oxoacyl-[acyl-carrier-protein] synthase-1/3-oxoacyl-[acyl-carrier-protein] synthase II
LGDNLPQINQNLYEQNVAPSLPKGRLESVFSSEYPVFQAPPTVLAQKKDVESFSFLFLRSALKEALDNAELSHDDFKKARIGAVIGTSVDASFNYFDFYRSWRKGENPPTAPLDKYIRYSISEEVLKFLGLSGISQTIVTACASGTDAIGIGASWIENDFCDIVIAGGADELNLIPYNGFIKLMIAVQYRCKPFDKDRKGINLGEGAGIFILESDKIAAARKAPKKGMVLGYGSACDGYHITSPHPEGVGLKRSLNFALKQAFASNNPSDYLSKIAFINAHATSSIDNDAVEAKIYNSVLPDIPVNATKSLTGHCLGAAGAVEACLTLMSLNEGKIPKTNNFLTPDEKLNLIPVLENTAIPLGKAAISSSLSFGGCNSVLILGGADYE